MNENLNNILGWGFVYLMLIGVVVIIVAALHE